jgi:hypothetical protein
MAVNEVRSSPLSLAGSGLLADRPIPASLPRPPAEGSPNQTENDHGQWGRGQCQDDKHRGTGETTSPLAVHVETAGGCDRADGIQQHQPSQADLQASVPMPTAMGPRAKRLLALPAG